VHRVPHGSALAKHDGGSNYALSRINSQESMECRLKVGDVDAIMSFNDDRAPFESHFDK